MRKKLMTLLTIIVLTLTACGVQLVESTEMSMTDNEDAAAEIHWKLIERKIPDAGAELEGEVSERLLGIAGDTVYHVVSRSDVEDGIRETYIQMLKAPYEEWTCYTIAETEWIEEASCIVQNVSLGEEGVFFLLTDNAGKGYYKAEWKPDEELAVIRIPDWSPDDDFFADVRASFVDSDDITYYAKTTGVTYFDDGYEVQKDWRDTGYVWQFIETASGDGKVYLCGNTINGDFRISTVTTGEPVLLANDISFGFTGAVAMVDDNEGYVCMPEGIHSFQVDTGETEYLMNFQEQGYSVERIEAATVTEQGSLLMLVSDGTQLRLLERVVDDKWNAKKKLELVTLSADLYLKETIAAFNRQSDGYYIILREQGEEDWQDYMTRIQVEIGSGAGPDIISSEVIDIFNAVQKGLLKNLSEEFQDENARIAENVWASGTVEGECYAIPYCFHVDTLVVSSDRVDNKLGWTTEEFVKTVEKSGAEVAISGMDSANLFWRMIDSAGLIDWEQGKSFLDSEIAEQLLEFAEKYGDKGTYVDAGVRIVEGETLASWGFVSGLDNLAGHLYEAMFEGKEVYIGYPTVDGAEGGGNKLYSRALAINQACEYPEGAVAFIRFMLEQDRQMEMAEKTCNSFLYQFPVDKVALEYSFQYAKEVMEAEEALPAYYSGFQYLTGPVSDEAMEKLHKLLQDARPITNNTSGVETIVFEEVAAYFAGDRTAEDVCNTMQNRVQLYLDESR